MTKISMIATMIAILAFPQFALAKTPGITMAQARVIALKASHGKIDKAEREHEGGGIRYSFDVREGKRIHEIGVDAITGKIIEDKYEALNARD